MSQSMIDPKKNRQLLIDDGAIETADGVRRVLHEPIKCGPMIRGGVQSRTPPMWNPEKELWEWWYMGQFTHYATSSDGENWELPSLGLYEWEGSRQNNIACDPAMPRLYHIMRDEADPDSGRRYKGLFGSGGRQLGVSPDGFDWTMLDVTIPSSDESQFTYDPQTGRYLAFVKLGTDWGRSVWLSTSEDFRSFTEPELIFHSDEVDWENCRQRVREIIENPVYLTPPIVDDEDYKAEIYNMAVLPYQGLYVGFPTVFNPFGAIPPPATNYTRINQIEMSVSRDLHHWERVADREIFIGVEPWRGDNYGTCQLLPAGAPVVREDGEIWCYYNALRLPGSREQYQEYNRSKELFRLGVSPEVFEDSGALSLAKLPQDRFAALEADEAGQILTKPFDLKGEDVYINADASWGKIYVEIADAETRKAHTGFWVPAEEPAPFVGDEVRAKVAWKPTHDLVFERPVRLRFYLHQARLYSFWIE
ncbi:MAG: hypothetical protein HN712_11805 [Gemmatimonadetes bacterium]|jgi:hypothetical protein|nr:hypothetical protein [Gemmatimonadota bacterium]MBT7860993.1 hypothetical protein [Gemmatimonadota bacterium]